MTGNATEWIADWQDEAQQMRGIRGGNYFSSGRDVIFLVRRGAVEFSRLPWLGFRIVMDLPTARAASGEKK